MLGTKEIVKEAKNLPVEERAAIITSLLHTLNPSNSEMDDKWLTLAKQRLAELQNGKVSPISGEKVFAKVEERFA